MSLENIDSPEDLKKISPEDLPATAKEIRELIIDVISKNGGHIAPSLGVVELTLALHYSLEENDRIVWDVGHQAYAHKILTGRKNRFETIRKKDGIAGFPKRDESKHDSFNTGHSSTSISAALGIAQARDLKKENRRVVAVIGDGALTGGMAFEAINHAGHLRTDLTVILNDNKMSISSNIGALSKYLNKLSETAHEKRNIKTIFNQLGFSYYGPYDGHNIKELITVLNETKDAKGPTLIHVKTKKGKGYIHAENNKEAFHGISSFDIETGKKNGKSKKTYTSVFSDTIVKLADENEKIIGITAAMPDGTGLSEFGKRFPSRFFDVAIAEQHAVTFAAGLASCNLKPVVAIYSTFLQRGYDQMIHDVCLQNLPIVFCLDRAGLVGEDGPTHHGTFDLSYLRTMPNMIVMAPKDENELQHMLKTAVEHNGPIAIRYPRGSVVGVDMDSSLASIPLGKSEALAEGNDIAIVAIGSMVYPALNAAKQLKEKGISAAMINARFAKPIDNDIIEKIKQSGKAVIIEENSKKGGFGSAILEELSAKGIKADIKVMALPDSFVDHGSISEQREQCGLTEENIIKNCMELK
ncbi:MAG: 1-deoxy-D-xylulose-5-phosphate synthase [bacterium]|nr:1-deoxy-D-xylulose-5-phosphate synthase [bacterium]